jgi:hypothetical protein
MICQAIGGFTPIRKRRVCGLLNERRERPMMESDASLASELLDEVLELSADAQIQRRATVKDTPAFHNLTGEVAAYGKVLGLLTAVEKREEFYSLLVEMTS